MKVRYRGIQNISIALFLLITRSIGWGPDTIWTKTYPFGALDRVYACIQTNDGGYAVVGNFFLKTDSLGDTVWSKNLGGYCVQQTNDSGYVIARYTVYNGYPYASLTKTDESGNELWTSRFGQSGVAMWVHQTSDSGYIVAGCIGAHGSENIYVAKTNSYGDTVWSRTFGNAYGGQAFAVQQNADGNYIVTGFVNLPVVRRALVLLCLDENGDSLWAKTYKGKSFDDVGRSVQQTTDGGYIIAGWTRAGPVGLSRGYDLWLLKTDANGDTVWTRTCGGSDHERAFSVQQTVDGGYAVAGNTLSFGAGKYDFYALKTDGFGSTLWAKVYGGTKDDLGRTICQTRDGGYIIGGATNSAGNEHVLLVKTEADVSLVSTIDIRPDVLNIKSNGKWVTCYVELGGDNSVDDINISTVRIGAIDGFAIPELYRVGPHTIGDYDSDGIPDLMVKFDRQTLIGVMQTRITTPASVALAIGGELIDSTSFLGADIISVICPGGPHARDDIIGPVVSSIYPNPFVGRTEIRYEIPPGREVTLKLYDVTGRLVKQWNRSAIQRSNHVVWDSTDDSGKQVSSGVYFLRFKTDDFTSTQKLVLLR